MSIPLLDLRAQYRSIQADLDAAVQRVVAAQAFVLGPEVEAFEEEMAAYLGVPHAIGCASGTDALLLPLRAIGPEPGDEVVIPAFTFFATAGAVWNAGFRPVFCDIDAETFNVTPETVEAAWTSRTRAVVPVHLFGQMAPMEGLNALAGRKSAWVVEDAAQAVGARRNSTMAGAAASVGAFSFFPTKNLGGFGDGGLVSTHDSEIADKVAKLRVHGGRQMYHHEMVGTNSRLDALQAAVLRAKLPHLEDWTEARRRHAAIYDERLGGVEGVRTPYVAPGNHHVYNQYTLRADRRDELRAHLEKRGVGSGVYYPIPLHLQACFESLGYREGELPLAERACREVLSLPVFPELGEDRAHQVADAVADFYEG